MEKIGESQLSLDQVLSREGLNFGSLAMQFLHQPLSQVEHSTVNREPLSLDRPGQRPARVLLGLHVLLLAESSLAANVMGIQIASHAHLCHVCQFYLQTFVAHRANSEPICQGGFWSWAAPASSVATS